MSDFEDRIKNSLDRSVEELDSDVTRRLRLIRHQALQQATNPVFSWKLPAAALASLSVMVIAVLLAMQNNQDIMPEILAENIEPVDVMVMNENMELLEELEFMQWLELNSESAG